MEVLEAPGPSLGTMEMGIEAFTPSLFPSYVTSPSPEAGNESISFGINASCPVDVRLVDFSAFEYHYRKDTWIPITWREFLKILAYTIVFLVSLTGNLLVILVVYHNTHMRTTTNQYLVNLAAADLMVTLVCMWVHLVRHLSHPHYVLPALVCKLDGFVQATAMLASVLTLTVISVGRFFAVMFPLHARTSPDRARRVIALVWLLSAAIACPTLFYRELYKTEWANFTTWQCEEFWPLEGEIEVETGHCVITKNVKKIYYTLLTIALYFLPVGIMLVNYSLVVWRLWVTQLPGEHSAPARNMAARAKKKVVKMVSVVLLVYVACWTPLQSIILYSSLAQQQTYLPPWFSSVEFGAYFVAYSNSALNPIIYCGFNANFRQGLVSLLSCRHGGTDRSYHRPGTWNRMTGGTRDTTVGCSGPEPAVLLEFSSLKKSSRIQKWSVTSQPSGRITSNNSSREILNTTNNDISSDIKCKNCCSDELEGQQQQQQQGDHHLNNDCTATTIFNHHNHNFHNNREGRNDKTGDRGEGGGGEEEEEGRDGTDKGMMKKYMANSSPPNSSRVKNKVVGSVCGCCRKHKKKKWDLPTHNHQQHLQKMEDRKEYHCQEDLSNNTQEDML